MLRYSARKISIPRMIRFSSTSSSAAAASAIDSAYKSFQVWKNVPASEKRDIFIKSADLLTERKDQLVKLTQQEIGIPTIFSELFVDDSIGYMRTLADLVVTTTGNGQILAPVQGRVPIIFKEPIGPVFGIVPWNAPTILGLRAAASPLAAGCSVIIKTSEVTPLTQRLILQTLIDAGVPKGALNILEVSTEDTPKIVEQIISDARIRKVNFTGSGKVGSKIGELAGKHLKPVVLELGGKGAVIVDKSADLVSAAINVVVGAWANSGQICMSTERVFVVKEVADEFKQIINKVSSEESSKEYLQSKQVHGVNAIRTQKLAQDAIDKGAEGIIPVVNGNDVSKSILFNVNEDMEIYDNESFGPIVYINVVDSIDLAIEEVNSSKYGLNTSVWTSNIGEGIEIAKRIESGAVHINGNTVFDDGTVPHGGVKNSGFGRFGGIWGIDEFKVIKAITYPI